jgi:hypothetical protein
MQKNEFFKNLEIESFETGEGTNNKLEISASTLIGSEALLVEMAFHIPFVIFLDSAWWYCSQHQRKSSSNTQQASVNRDVVCL